MGVLLRGIKREQIRRGQVIAAINSIKPVTKFLAQLYVSAPLTVISQRIRPRL
jgi:elongation factor Tu